MDAIQFDQYRFHLQNEKKASEEEKTENLILKPA